jgi:hypothetical protein
MIVTRGLCPVFSTDSGHVAGVPSMVPAGNFLSLDGSTVKLRVSLWRLPKIKLLHSLTTDLLPASA